MRKESFWFVDLFSFNNYGIMKYALYIVQIFFLLLSFNLQATKHYIDPVNGNVNNDGTSNSPWSTLESVINDNFIASYSYLPLPYDASTSVLTAKNQNAQVHDGDTLMLRSGLHGEIFIKGYFNNIGITVMAEDGQEPIIKSLRLIGAKNWNFIGISVSSEPYGAYLDNKLVLLETHEWHGPVSNISMSYCNIYSSDLPFQTAEEWLDNASDGIYIKGDSINIINNKLRNVVMGITARGDFINVVNNEVVNFSGDGLRLLGSYDLFEGNLVKNCYNVDENHDDGIQSFTTNGLIVDHNIIRGNTIINREDPNQILAGSLQGMGFFDGMYRDWIVENNLVYVDHYHGITFLGAVDCKIVNNTVLDPSPQVAPGGSWIMIADHKDGTASSGNIVANNVANKINVNTNVFNNIELPNKEDYSAHFVDYEASDFHLISTSSLIDAGDATLSPDIDLDEVSRPQGENTDIGCYEFVFTTSNTAISNPKTLISVYPNPVKDHFIIESPTKVSYKIYNSYGQLMSSSQTDILISNIDLQGMNSGLYLILFFDRNNTVIETKTIMKL